MYENQYDEIATPRAFKHATSGMIRGMLERSFVDVALFPCPTYGTGAIWDLGICVGYFVYALPEHIGYLKNCEDILSQLGHTLSRLYYTSDDLRPYGMVRVVSDVRLFNASLEYKAYFLECCWTKTEVGKQ